MICKIYLLFSLCISTLSILFFYSLFFCCPFSILNFYLLFYIFGVMFFSLREKLNQLGFSWELPTHTKRKRKGDEDLTATTDPLLEDGAASTEEKKADIEIVAEIVPVVMTGGGSSKWPHEVRSLQIILMSAFFEVCMLIRTIFMLQMHTLIVIILIITLLIIIFSAFRRLMIHLVWRINSSVSLTCLYQEMTSCLNIALPSATIPLECSNL